MISGTVHIWDWIELLYTLDRIGYDGWLGGDIAPKHIGPVEAYRTNTLMVQRMAGLLQRMGPDKIAAFVSQDGNIAETFDFLSAHLVPAAEAWREA
jgi:hypothetical protein